MPVRHSCSRIERTDKSERIRTSKCDRDRGVTVLKCDFFPFSFDQVPSRLRMHSDFFRHNLQSSSPSTPQSQSPSCRSSPLEMNLVNRESFPGIFSDGQSTHFSPLNSFAPVSVELIALHTTRVNIYFFSSNQVGLETNHNRVCSTRQKKCCCKLVIQRTSNHLPEMRLWKQNSLV